MELGALLMVVLGFVAAGGITAFVVKSSLRGHGERDAAVLRSDAAFRRIAADLGLEFLEGESIDHPIMGRLLGFGRLRGRVQGVGLRVEVAFDSAGSGVVHFYTEVAVEPSARIGQLVAERVSAMAQRFPEGDLDIEDGWLTLTVRRGASPGFSSYVFALLDEASLRSVIDRLVDVSTDASGAYR
jgi:hypothetical protein